MCEGQPILSTLTIPPLLLFHAPNAESENITVVNMLAVNNE